MRGKRREHTERFTPSSGGTFLLSPCMIETHRKGKRLLVRKKHTSFTLRDGYQVHVAHERPPQARQRAVVVSLDGILRDVEHACNLQEAQLPETAQVDNGATLQRKGKQGQLQRPLQVTPLGRHLRQRLGVRNGLDRRELLFPVLPLEG